MGVTGLWKLIEPCGAPVPIETLEGKILAIDISIWLHQVVKGFQDSSGSALAHAHLLGLFHRLCKLMYYRVKPVFVFDGSVPTLKLETIARRKQQRSKLNNEANRIQNLLLEQLAKEEIVQKALGNAANELVPTKRNTAKGAAARAIDDEDMFKLPELPSTSHNVSDPSCHNDGDSSMTSFDTSDESSFEEGSAKHHYQNNLQSIDVKSEQFRSLPADMRYDILLDIKETRKQSSWGRLHELPAQSDDFSGFQMKRLLKRRAVQESLEVAEQEMGGRTLTYSELQTFFKEEGILSSSALEEASRPIAGDENTRFLLVRDLKKQIKQEENKANETLNVEVEEKPVIVKKSESRDSEFDANLQLALALSLETNGTDEKLYDEKDYVLEEGEKLKLSKVQRKHLQNAAKGPARTYMLEHAGMNTEELTDILEATQTDLQPNDNKEATLTLSDSDSDDDFLEVPCVEIEEKLKLNKVQPKHLQNAAKGPKVTDMVKSTTTDLQPTDKIDSLSDSDSDDDFMEVPSGEIKEKGVSANKLEIVIDPNYIEKDDDMFSDVFDNLKNETNQKIETAIVEKPQLSVLSANKLEIVIDPNYIEKDDDMFADVFDNLKNETNQKIETAVVEKPQLSVLEELQRQLKEAQNINLDAVEVKNDIIEVLSDEEIELPKKREIIEICDDGEKLHVSPSITPRKGSKQAVTPKQNKSITDFYEAVYIVKQTPDEVKEELHEHLAKVVPFFRKKTPKSKSPKSDSNANSPITNKTAKKLFADEAIPTKTRDEILQEAADALKQKTCDSELHTMASNLAQERRDLESERNRQDRMGMSITQRMNEECQELLRLFGIPYIVAPMEAEAQCAFLDAMELTNGTITDDSDIWLFGGRTVYKNFFAQNKHVLKYSANEIEDKFKCDRQALVQLACLVGSDYTTGVNGIGAVTALEILSSFAGSRVEHKIPENMRDKISVALGSLQRFRDWWQASKMAAVVPGSSARHKLLKKLKNIDIHEGFPSMAVVEAYLYPKVDESLASFSWGQPDIESVREFARKTFGWTVTKTDDVLRPVLKRLNEKRTQTSLKNYFAISKPGCSVPSRKLSKRVQSAVDRLASGPQEGHEESETPALVQKRKTTGKRKVNTGKNTKDKEAPVEHQQDPTASSMGEKIPQREKHLEELRQNRKKAAQILKASGGPGRKRK